MQESGLISSLFPTSQLIQHSDLQMQKLIPKRITLQGRASKAPTQ